jgi:cytochrome c peroxidase
MKKRAILAFLLCAAAGVAAWQAAAVFLLSAPSAQFNPPSFYPLSAAEPISPIPHLLALDARKVALGRRLFNDSRLSGDNSLACASCHVLARGGVDGRRRSVGFKGQLAERNTPTVFNAVFNFRQFWDGRAASLEEQVDGPIHNPREMASSWPEIMAKLSLDEHYLAAFGVIYGAMEPAHIKDAIAEFERSLLTPGSRFDRYLEGDRDAVTRDELKGYQLFKSYGCIACHQGVNVGGNLYERLGALQSYAGLGTKDMPEDLGRMAITGSREDLLVFKVPGLRNVARTAPYFHDGSVPTLEQAVILMGRYQLGVAIAPEELALIVQFLGTLTGNYEERLP